MTFVYLWKIRSRNIPLALMHMAVDRFLLSRIPGVTFFKSIGTGTGEKFTPSDANPHVWGIIVVTEDVASLEKSFPIRSWRRTSISELKLALSPISSHGKWAGKDPFKVVEKHEGKEIVAITRARIKWRKSLLFWRAVPAVTTSLHSQPGLISAIGIGEAPVGLQGTLSIWEDASALREFAYKGAAHISAISETENQKWYSEELFARFSLVQQEGSI